MTRQVVILHGWSDDSESFEDLAQFLKSNGYRTVPIFLGDYVSLRNEIRIEDVAKSMEQAIRERMALPARSRQRLGPSFHLVVHSTGGLVARRWISSHYPEGGCPVKNLVMLAPANFGSVLAHKGRSLVSRLVKGWRTGFETGDEMLFALELGSQFQWDLARADLFARGGSEPALYGADRVRPFVITGTHPYRSAVRKLLNENGSDGTVRVAAANLNARGMTVDFTGGPKRLEEPAVSPWPLRGEGEEFPLAVLPGRDHSLIKEPSKPGFAASDADRRRLGELILQALAVNTARQYRKARDDWAAVTAATRTLAGASVEAKANRRRFFRSNRADRQYFHEHYQLHLRAVDEFGEPVDDYFVAFMPQWKKKKLFGLRTSMPREGVFFHDEVLAHVHRHRRDRAHLCMYLDRYDMMGKGGFYDRVSKDKRADLAFTVTATDPGDDVAYFSRSRSARRGLIPLHDRESLADRWLGRHCTHFIELVIPRVSSDRVFRLDRA